MTPEKLPRANEAVVSRTKVVEYLLSHSHPDGQGKARFFNAHGFSEANWEQLAAALRSHGTSHAVQEAVETHYEFRYLVEGALPSPNGRTPRVRTVWFIRAGYAIPELVTAYPIRRRT